MECGGGDATSPPCGSAACTHASRGCMRNSSSLSTLPGQAAHLTEDSDDHAPQSDSTTPRLPNRSNGSSAHTALSRGLRRTFSFDRALPKSGSLLADTERSHHSHIEAINLVDEEDGLHAYPAAMADLEHRMEGSDGGVRRKLQISTCLSSLQSGADTVQDGLISPQLWAEGGGAGLVTTDMNLSYGGGGAASPSATSSTVDTSSCSAAAAFSASSAKPHRRSSSFLSRRSKTGAVGVVPTGINPVDVSASFAQPGRTGPPARADTVSRSSKSHRSASFSLRRRSARPQGDAASECLPSDDRRPLTAALSPPPSHPPATSKPPPPSQVHFCMVHHHQMQSRAVMMARCHCPCHSASRSHRHSVRCHLHLARCAPSLLACGALRGRCG